MQCQKRAADISEQREGVSSVDSEQRGVSAAGIVRSVDSVVIAWGEGESGVESGTATHGVGRSCKARLAPGVFSSTRCDSQITAVWKI